MKPHVFLRGLLSLTLCTVGAVSMVYAGTLLKNQVLVVQEVRSVSLPLLAELPTLERKVDILEEQVELAEIQAAMRTGSKREQIFTYALPAEHELDRLVAMFDTLRLMAEQYTGITSMSSVDFDEEITVREGLNARPVRFTVEAPQSGIPDLLRIFSLAGALTVSDVLSRDELDLLLEHTAAENPTGIVALEQFLSTDVLQYTLEPRAHEEPVRRAFGEGTFLTTFNTIVSTSFLRDARGLLGGGVGSVLKEQRLWPMPFMTVEDLTLQPAENGAYSLSITVWVYRRAEDS